MPTFALRTLALGISFTALAAPAAMGDDFVREANALYADVRPDRRSDTIVLPALAKLQPPPAGLATLDAAMLLPADGAGWAEAAAWAQGATQAAVIEAVGKAVAATDWRQANAWGQPYGIEGVPLDLIRAGMYTELGDPPLLADARVKVLTALDHAAILFHVEATRLAAEGKPLDAMMRLADWALLARQFADRQLFREARWGFAQIGRAMERIRDIAYEDIRGPRKLTPDDLTKVIQRLDEESGPLTLDRVRFPQADRLGARQVLAALYPNPRGGVDERLFAPTLARLGASEHPLRLFSETARLSAMAPVQADRIAAEAELPKVFDDWANRWNVDWWDPRMSQTFYAAGALDRTRFAAVAAAAPPMGELFELRQVARTEAVGTRQALAVAAFNLSNRTWPPTVEATRPRFIRTAEADPLNPNRGAGQRPPMQYFVPNGVNARPLGPRDEPRPHRAEIVTGSGLNFAAQIPGDTFVMYSVGADGARNWADRVQNAIRRAEGADYLMWPPVLSLRREHLRQTGELK